MAQSKDAVRRAAKDADDIEYLAFLEGEGVRTTLEDALYDDNISEEAREQGLNFDIAADPDKAEDDVQQSSFEDLELDSVIDEVRQIIQARSRILQGLYPFILDGNNLRYVRSRTLAYELCLAIASIPNIARNPYRPLQVAFERLTGAAMGLLIGGGKHIRTGYPGMASEDPDEVGSLSVTVQVLNDRMPDRWIIDERSDWQDLKDGGVDVIVYKEIDDREGSLLFVGNCGCGRNWLREGKHKSRASDSLEKFLVRPRRVNLIDFLALPFHVVPDTDWVEALHEGRFVLDRLRIAKVVEGAGAGGFDLDGALRRPAREYLELASLMPRG